MNIGIDVSPIVYGTGVSMYTKNLVENLLDLDKDNNYQLFFSSLRQQFPGLDHNNFELKQTKIPPTLLNLLWNKLHILPIETFTDQLDVFHCSDWTQPPTKNTPTVTTIHDLSFLRWPDSAHPKVLDAQSKRLNWVKKEADQIIAVSKATKQEIIELLDIPEDKITVIYEGLPEDVQEFSFLNSKFKNIKKKYNLPDNYLFAFGSQAPRKNINRLVKAFKNISKEFKDLHLVITGRYKPKQKLPKKVITPGFLDRKELLNIFSQAQALVYPSTYEGFGIPILEAFALDVPVVTSNCSSMDEIVDNAGIKVNSKSIKSIEKGIIQVMTDKEKQKQLIINGNKRLSDFSWKKTAQQTLEVYHQVLK
jgi:glycosyltransferase involved in cell wall biosynthesis